MPEKIEQCPNLQRGVILTATSLLAKALAAGATKAGLVKRSWGTVNTLVNCRDRVASIETLCATPDICACASQPFSKGVHHSNLCRIADVTTVSSCETHRHAQTGALHVMLLQQSMMPGSIID